MSETNVKAIAIALTVLVIAGLGAGGYFYYQSNTAQQRQQLLLSMVLYHDLTHVTVIIDYGNGTRK